MKGKTSGVLKRISEKTELIITALLTSKDYAEACRKAGISEASLYRLLKDDSFTEQLQEAKRKVVETSIIRLQNYCNEAVSTLIEIMQNNSTPPSIRATCAKAVLDMTLKMTENEEIIKRIERLEKVVNQ